MEYYVFSPFLLLMLIWLAVAKSEDQTRLINGNVRISHRGFFKNKEKKLKIVRIQSSCSKKRSKGSK